MILYSVLHENLYTTKNLYEEKVTNTIQGKIKTESQWPFDILKITSYFYIESYFFLQLLKVDLYYKPERKQIALGTL